jgi:hypothetical protein
VSSEGWRINEYANSMFRFEQLHDKWIESCAAYLRHLFGEQLKGKTVVDYSFGRGNWSLAFRLAGARRVFAIDAAQDSVNRFQEFCRQRNIDDVEVICGNLLEQDVAIKADFIWVYGLLQHITDQSAFLERVKGLASSPEALFYFYYYNANSLRHFIVETCRRVIVYPSEHEFVKDSYLFSRPARMRARDDLTAPYLSFRTAAELAQLLRAHGLYVRRQDDDFQLFLKGVATEDFYPHQFLCTLNPEDEIKITEPEVAFAPEIEVLREFSAAVFSLQLSGEEKKNIAVGLFNTHFSFLTDGVYAKDSVIEVFLLLNYVLLQKADPTSRLSPEGVAYRNLVGAALAGRPRSEREQFVLKEMAGNCITDYLLSNNLRV